MKRTNISDSYPLSPMQQAMLFYSVYTSGSGLYVQQMIISLQERLDVSAFIQAWQYVLARHPVLRTSFFGVDSGNPHQDVYGPVSLPFARQNWRDLSAEQQTKQLEAYLQLDRQRGFKLDEPPLMRLSLFQMAENHYQLVWTSHHALFDGRSRLLIIKEVFAFYEACFQQQDLQIAQPRPYRDYIEWLQQYDLSSSEIFWRQALKGFTAATPLTVDRPPAALPPSEITCHEQEIRLSKQLTTTLRSLAQQHNVTPYTFVQGAWALLLSRYSGNDDVLFGATRACRYSTIEGAKSMVGLFINTLPVRVQVPPQTSLLTWLKELRANHVALRNYEHTPLPRILGWSDVTGSAPLFESVLVFENYDLNTILKQQGPEWANREFQLLQQTNYPLTVAGHTGENLALSISYDCHRFDGATISRMLGHLKTLLVGMTANLENPISHLSLLTEAEQHQLLVVWNDTQADYPQNRCIHQLFEDRVKQTPAAIAVTHKDKQLTYRELNADANRLAHYLRKQGVGANVIVGICMERSLEMVVGLLAILKAGGAYLPLDPTYPPDRLAFMLEDAQVSLLLTHKSVANLPRYKAHLVYVDSDWGAISTESEENPGNGAVPENLAYVIYTSGSTGKPKGVGIEHKNLLNLIYWHQRAFSISRADRATQIARLSFDAAIWELWPYLTTGASIHLLPDEETRISPTKFQRWLISEKITIAFVPTSLAEKVLSLAWPEHSQLRFLLTGGDKLNNYPPEAIPFKLVNNYGPTECTVVATSATIYSNRQSDKPPSIGRPIANSQIYLLDKNLAPVPIGVPGELHIGGVGLAHGYLNRPELTARRFIPNPFNHQPDARLYKTGDLARYLPDGNLEFLGRIDQQVKIRGFRIELEEIEEALRKHPSLKEVVVVAREDMPGNKRLAAYVIPVRGQSPATVKELSSFLRQTLPDYMVPRIFVTLDNLPLTPNGKINRVGLPAPDPNYPEQVETYVAPSSPIEQVLAGIWSEILGLNRAGINDNFFDAGGHSLLAVQVISRIWQAFQVKLPVPRLFETPTIAGLAKYIDSARNAGQRLQEPPLQPGLRAGNLYLSFAQQRLWFLDRLEPGNAVFNISQAIQLTGPLDVAALEQGINEIINRHEALRTTFSDVNGQPVQIITAPLSYQQSHRKFLTLSPVNLRGMPEPKQEAEAQRRVTAETAHPFNLARGPLVRATLLQLGEAEHLLQLTMHHIVTDGWSLNVFLRELSMLYKAFSAGEPSPLPDLPIQYVDYAAWQRKWLQGQVLNEQLDYWKKQLKGAPPLLELPLAQPRPPVQRFQGDTQPVIFPPALSKAIRDLSRQEGATLFITLLAAFQVLLHRYTQQDDIVTGTPVANRNRAEIEDLIGFFANTLVMRTDLSGNPPFRQLLNRVRAVALEAYAYQDLPFEKLVEDLQPERNLSHSPLFQVMFVLQNIPQHPLQLPGVTATPLQIDRKSAKYDLTLFVTENREELTGELEYNTGLFDTATIKRMIDHFQTLLEGIVATPDLPISQLPLLTKAEQHQLLVAWNNTKADYPADQCFHHLFETQAIQTPNAIAVSYKDQNLTYRELNTRANQVAHYLKKQGVAPEVLVGIHMRRSLEMVVGLLGILKAGGAYVPLDPAYPTARLAFMLEDSRVPLLLTRQQLVPGLPQREINIICLDSDWEVIAQESEQNPAVEMLPKNLAYVIYTSGSTGQPKGTLISHRGWVNYLSWAGKAYQVAAGRGAPVHSSLSFDLTITALFLPLLAGRCATLIPEEAEVEALSLTLLNNNNFSLVKITPAHLEMLGHLLPASEVTGRTRRLIIGGEALRAEQLAFWQENAPDTRLVNEYGPTEAVVGCCTYETTSGSGPRGMVPIGRPIDNTQLYLLDRHLNPVPTGIPGELYIGGDGLARGYLNRPKLTAENFIWNPFSNKPGARLYKTGDMARYLPDGNIEFLGRVDNQVKIRGFRIELGEVEAVLQQHPSITRAVVMVHEKKTNDKQLVAYFVSKPGETPTTGDLRKYLKQTLPEYMAPSVFVALDNIPLTPNGKVNRQLLPVPNETRPELDSAFVPPQTPVEQALAGIWAELLALEQVGIDDNFFELGGHSLLAARLFSQIEKTFNKKLPLATLFQAPTVAQLAPIISRKASPVNWFPLVTIQPGVSKPPFFCVHGWGGGVIGYADLARLLGPEQPFYGLQARGLNGIEKPHTRITDMASAYLKAVHAVQPEGPYYLGGYCQGGVIAFEMAQQLQAQGERVALLSLFESYAPVKIVLWDQLRHPRSVINFIWNLPFLLMDYWQLGIEGMLVRVRRKTRGVWKRFTGRAKVSGQIHLEDILDDISYIPEDTRTLMKIHVLAGRNYKPQIYAGQITLFRAQSLSLFHSFDPTMGWNQLAAGGIEIKKIAGAHRNILKQPHVQTLAAQLNSSLEQAQAGIERALVQPGQRQ